MAVPLFQDGVPSFKDGVPLFGEDEDECCCGEGGGDPDPPDPCVDADCCGPGRVFERYKITIAGTTPCTTPQNFVGPMTVDGVSYLSMAIVGDFNGVYYEVCGDEDAGMVDTAVMRLWTGAGGTGSSRDFPVRFIQQPDLFSGTNPVILEVLDDDGTDIFSHTQYLSISDGPVTMLGYECCEAYSFPFREDSCWVYGGTITTEPDEPNYGAPCDCPEYETLQIDLSAADLTAIRIALGWSSITPTSATITLNVDPEDPCHYTGGQIITGLIGGFIPAVNGINFTVHRVRGLANRVTGTAGAYSIYNGAKSDAILGYYPPCTELVLESVTVE